MYFNELSQIVSAATASATFSTSIVVQNFDIGAIEVGWTNLSHANAIFRLRGGNSGRNPNNLTVNPTTFTSGSDNQVYDLSNAGYAYLQCDYDPGSSTTGTIDIWVTKKSRK